MSAVAKFTYMTEAGSKEGQLALEDYKLAARHGMSTSQYINHKYSDADPKYGSAFHQGMMSLGIHVMADPARGIQPTMVQDILEGNVVPTGIQAANGQTLTAPGTQGTTPATRIFFPEVVLELIQSALIEDYGPELQAWNRMISGTDRIPTEMFTQPTIDVTAPRSERSQAIAQNALPRTMIGITAAQSSKNIITNSIGLQISDQAQLRATIDLVSTILLSQAEGERFARLWEDIANIISGNDDAGQAALSATAASTYDAAATGGTMTQKAWLKALYDPTRKVSYDSMLCTLDTFLAIQDRTNRPVIFDPRTSGANVGDLGNYGLNVEPNVLNWSVGVPNCLIVPDGTVAASNVLLFDSRYAMRRAVNTSAEYAAVEQMVLQRSTAMRFDFGELTYRLRDEAFKLLDFS